MKTFHSWRRVAAAGLVLAAGISGLTSLEARAQFPEKFENLKVLPKKISKDELRATMRGFSMALGVRCDYCHAEAKTPGPNGEPRLDFPSDEKHEKATARDMIRMADAINGEYLAKMKPKLDLSVGCVTCHHGIPHPQTLGALLKKADADSGATVAIANYRKLRDRYYGSASYDFSEASLNTLGQDLLEAGKPADALAFLELNAEYYADSGWLQGLLGDAYVATGDKDKARAAYQKALAAQPDNMRLKKKLDALGSN